MKKCLSLLIFLIIHAHSEATEREAFIEEEVQQVMKTCPHLQNIGFLMCADSTIRTAIQLTPKYVLTSGASEFGQYPQNTIFIQAQSCDIPMTGTDLDLGLTKKELKRNSVPFSSFKVLYKPQKESELQQIVMAHELDVCKSYMDSFISKLIEITLFLDAISHEFPLLGRDISILELETPLPIQDLPVRGFSSAEISEMKSICIGAQAKVVPITAKKKACRVSLTAFVQMSTYDKTSNIFYNSFKTRGGVPETFSPKELSAEDKLTGLIGCETLGAPLFFMNEDNQRILGGIMSNGYTTERLRSFVEEVVKSKDESVKRNARGVKKHYEELMKGMVPVYNISTSLEWVVGKILRVGIVKTAEEIQAKEIAARIVASGLTTEATPNMNLLTLMAPTEQEKEATRKKAKQNKKKRLAKKKKMKEAVASTALASSEGESNPTPVPSTISEGACDKSSGDNTIGVVEEETGSTKE
ncbi:MAG: hypothetical protein K2Y18_04445 [Alphaproteobacteria bacterium]|nr:hypothetical protein [Alphaproteobacteria bacterium]